MTIQRDDLVAAAAVGLLQYRQVDPLLIFLLQRDVRERRAALLAGVRPRPVRAGGTYVLSYLAGTLAIVTAALFALVFTSRAVESVGVGALFFFTLLYAVAALGLASWFKRRGLGAPGRILATLALALVPLAVFALQQAIR
jgi:hypothetical protein